MPLKCVKCVALGSWLWYGWGVLRGMNASEVLDFGKIKVHPRARVVRRVVSHIEPKPSRFSEYRVVLELADGTEEEFLFFELRDATNREQAEYESLRAGQERN